MFALIGGFIALALLTRPLVAVTARLTQSTGLAVLLGSMMPPAVLVGGAYLEMVLTAEQPHMFHMFSAMLLFVLAGIVSLITVPDPPEDAVFENADSFDDE